MELIMQEVSQERYIPIPDEVRDMYRLYRPTPLCGQCAWKRRWIPRRTSTYKNESVSPAGSHKLNTALAQAYYNKQAGVKRITTETGAGQWGSALAIAGAFFGIDIEVFMVKVSYFQKPYRRSVMQAYGANVTPSPSERTQRRTRDPGQAPGQHRQPGHRDLGGRGDGRDRSGDALLRWGPCSTTCCCTRR